MIEYDYRLQRNEGDELKTYAPSVIPTRLPNLVLIEGPNSSGKSTLLNLLALAFYALKTDKLNASLKNKIRDLVEAEHQKLKFSVSLSERDGSELLVAVKESFDKQEIVVREKREGKERILTSEAFQRRYNLIYDIPDNPIERLNQLVEEIKDAQNRYAARVASLRSAILKIIAELRDSRDPKQLENLAVSIKKAEGQLGQLQQEVTQVETLLQALEKYRFAKAYADVLLRLDVSDQELETLERTVKEVKKQEKRVDRNYRDQRDAAVRKIDGMKENHRMLTSILRSVLSKEERPSLETWERVDFDRALKEYDFSEVLTTLSRHFRGLLKRLVEADRKKMEEGKVYADLIRFLRGYQNSDVIIPGLDKPIHDFIEILEQASKGYESSRVLQERLTEAFQRFDTLDQDRRIALGLLNELRKAKSEFEGAGELVIAEDDVQVKVAKLHDDISELDELRKFYQTECAKRGVNEDNLEGTLHDLEETETLSRYRVYRDADLKSAIEGLRDDLTVRENRLRQEQLDVDIQKRELSRLEKKKPHKYQDQQPLLEDLLAKCLRLEQKLSKDFSGYLASMSTRKPDSPMNDEEKNYFEEVAKYLGRRLGTIRHVEGDYKVKSADPIRGVILTATGKSIHYSDMGTGQIQSAYLRSLLNTDDKRKIIALFDEVAMMDRKSLQPILRKLRELYEKERLLIGIVVQKADSVKVTPIEEVE